MKKKNQSHLPLINLHPENPRSELEIFFFNSVKEIYDAENLIEEEFVKIENKIISPSLHKILTIHFEIHLKHLVRLRKVFEFKGEIVQRKTCEAVEALMCEALNHLSHFSDDIANWEIALVLISQKLSHYKIATYGGLAHLAIKLNYPRVATLLAICVQEEEEFLANHLNGIFHSFLASHVDILKN